MITREKIIAGEQIVERRLVLEGKAIGFTGMIPRDKRAVSVAVTEVTGVAGFVRPGDYVDVIVTFDTAAAGDNVSNLVLQNILVLAVNREAADGVAPGGGKEAGNSVKDAVKSTTVTLAVTADEASRLTLSEEKGKIRLALCPYLPLTGLSINNSVTPKDLVGMHVSPVQNVPPANSNPPASVPYAAPPVRYREQVPFTVTSKPPVAGTKEIQMIKGTKIETVSMN